MEVDLGRIELSPNQQRAVGSNNIRAVWRASDVINGHFLIAGGSGVGKTHTIRNIIRSMVDTTEHPLRIHVLDVHGDIAIQGASEVFFSESTTVGLNPLIVDPDKHSGGVRKASQNFISTLNKSGRKLGDRQEAVLRTLLEELYAANHFYVDHPESWHLHDGVQRKYPKKFPTVNDLSRWAHFKYKQLYMGGSTKSSAALERVNKTAVKMQRLGKEDQSFVDEKLQPLKDEAIEAYSEYVTSINTGRELEELLKYDSKTTLKSVVDRIDNLRNSGVFRDNEPDFDPTNSVWRYKLNALSANEKKMFVLFKLKEIYDSAMKRGLCDHIREVVVLDEANRFIDENDPEDILSLMANEIRKFGVAIICASQSFTHFSEDIISSFATKIILGIDEHFWKKTTTQLQIKIEHLAWIIPREKGLIMIKRVPNPKDPASRLKCLFTRFND
ncbi:ATP-binding protein [Alteromonas sp. 14N.309.X.WAT.G.H12]|uniref:ATP-binding protein n=1 Tax=Alteromonas sp. 14N.309.X.WAT.G.H12 TaxID=3120824 RepID=UPI002FD61F6B